MKRLYKSLGLKKKKKSEIVPKYRKIFIGFNAFVHYSVTTIFTCDKQNKVTVHNWLLKSSKSEILIYNFENYFLLLP